MCHKQALTVKPSTERGRRPWVASHVLRTLVLALMLALPVGATTSENFPWNPRTHPVQGLPCKVFSTLPTNSPEPT